MCFKMKKIPPNYFKYLKKVGKHMKRKKLLIRVGSLLATVLCVSLAWFSIEVEGENKEVQFSNGQ